MDYGIAGKTGSVIKAQFVMGPGISSKLISWFSAGPFSHVDAVLPSGSLLGARSDQIGGAPAGVQVRYPDYDKWTKRVRMELETTRDETQKFYAFLNDQLGKPYDKTAILGFAAGRDWRDPN